MSKPTIESLPIELRIQIILQVPDLQSLQSIALSSTALYQAYILARQEAVPEILRRQYDGLVEIHEAIAAVRSKQFHANTPGDRHNIIALLDARRRSKEIRQLSAQSGSTLPLPDQPASYDEALDLVKLHEIAVWLLDDYSRNASCPFWMGIRQWKSEVLPLKFSALEKKRYFRAFYRFQTFCNLFGQTENPVDSGERPFVKSPWNRQYWEFEDDEVWKVFFGPFTPWEDEEFACLWQHFYDRIHAIYWEVSNDLEEHGPNESGELPEKLRATLLPSHTIRETDNLRLHSDNVREKIVSIGGRFLCELLREKDFVRRRDMIYANYLTSTLAWFPSYVPSKFSDKYPLLYPADRFNFGTGLDGLRAFLSTLPEIERPNLCFELTWLDEIEDDEPVFKEILEDGGDSRSLAWGYALWDNERLYKWARKYAAPIFGTTF
ncbi:uncharacterized protein DSM5745_06014 [Aspergillus mulundensis]|uniref:Uncharacterized protein n=1 Tax=Aspergillus mulundensis TaxID=1810919 RepID=A0A3D8RYP5_9EURO|nr:Uncharacterized protein DSM5745_06014 [Aspergillus mulundensis]RDW79162.1 Uncharacterized protein DSM5745_06014 [Aspergillus mulundensis]